MNDRVTIRDRKGEADRCSPPLPDSPANFAQRAGWIWREAPIPVIAAIHGVAYGGGLQVALGADIRIVAPDARMSVMEIKWGLIPDMSGTQTLRHLLRDDVARELTYTGRDRHAAWRPSSSDSQHASPMIRVPRRSRWPTEIATKSPQRDPRRQAAAERDPAARRRGGTASRDEPPEVADRPPQPGRGGDGQRGEAPAEVRGAGIADSASERRSDALSLHAEELIVLRRSELRAGGRTIGTCLPSRGRRRRDSPSGRCPDECSYRSP